MIRIKTIYALFLCILYNPLAEGQVYKPAHRRTTQIKEWENLKFGMFIHFGMNTYNDGQDYDDHHSPSAMYNPTQLNVAQWVKTAKVAGMKYAVLVAKHSSGFCLWDSENYEYDVATSSNKTDVVAEFMKACKEEGIKPGFYYCILDAYNKTSWTQKVSPEYFEQIKKHLTELHTKYPGAIEQWIDIPNLCTAEQLQEIYDLIKNINPKCLVLMNQTLVVSKKNQGAKIEPGLWPTDIVNGELYLPPPSGHIPEMEVDGQLYYIPMEVCDNGGDNSNTYDGTSSNNWFYTSKYKLRSPEQLYSLYSSCIARNSNLLLNIPPNKEGFIERDIVEELKKLKSMIEDGNKK